MEAFEINVSVFVYDYLIPCLFAIICGGIIGFERERIDRPAGLRTHILVCLGSAVFTLVSYLGFEKGFDPSRVAAGVVAGIGFIGAGVIFRQGIFVKGVTTAASIWVVAAVGIAIGTKLYYIAFITTILAFCVLFLVKILEEKLQKRFSYTMKITSDEGFEDTGDFIDYLKSFNIKVICEECSMERTSREGIPKISTLIKLESRDPSYSTKIMEIMKKFKGIDRIEIV